MVRFRHLLSGCALTACLASAAAAQSPYPRSTYPQSPYPQPGYVNPFAPLSDVDKLAQQLRIVAANPTDLYALLNAANLSLKVGDTDAAAALFTRADRISPQHPRVQAGLGRLMVQAGRPGEALRRFQQAERLGATLDDFGPDRALAYDLVGEQQRAQREYRALLRAGSDDETIRRYALSLGISGLKEPALALLEPLNRRSDRGAWRARAFVLAMTGDRSGAERIATTMMPSGMAQGLAPFFDRLPRLSASERAFAVNFGETRPSPTRLADARLVPPLPALSPEPNPFPQVRPQVQLANENLDDVNDGKKRKKKRKPRKERPESVRFARQSYSAPLPPPPAPTAAQLASLSATRLAPPRSAFNGGGRVTVLPPPADAYRGPETRATPSRTADASGDEPDFAVAAVSNLADANRSAGAASAPPPVTRATTAPRAVPGAPARDGFALTQSQPTIAPRAIPPVSSSPVSTVRANPPATTLAATTPPVAPGLGEFRLTGPATAPQHPAVITQPASGLANVAPPPAATVAASQPVTAASTANGALSAALPSALPPASGASVQPGGAPSAPAAVAAITSATGAPPPPTGASGDDVLAAIVANISVPPAELVTKPIAAPVAAPPIGRTRLLANVEKKAEADKAKGLAAKSTPALPLKDARGRFVDAKGKPLLDPGGRPLGPKAAAAWQLAQAGAAEDMAAKLPKKDARGRFVDAKGKPLLDDRGRPLGPKAAAAWQLAQAGAADDTAAKLPKKDARGRFVDTRGKPLLDDRGRPMGPKAAAAWQLAQADATDDKADAKLPKKDARGRFVDAKGKPLLDDRGRPLGPKAAAAWQLAQADTGAAKDKADAKLPKKDARGRYLDDKGKPLLDARGRPMDAKAAAAWQAAEAKKPDPAKGESARIWVQVAGGANQASLAREWKRVSGLAPALKARQGWTTPQRATNRILTGPLKSAAEATALVNQLRKEGVSGFMFTSDAGQKVTRLGAK